MSNRVEKDIVIGMCKRASANPLTFNTKAESISVEELRQKVILLSDHIFQEGVSIRVEDCDGK